MNSAQHVFDDAYHIK